MAHRRILLPIGKGSRTIKFWEDSIRAFTGHVVRWGQRVTPLGTSTVELPPNHQSALEIVQRYRAVNDLRVTA